MQRSKRQLDLWVYNELLQRLAEITSCDYLAAVALPSRYVAAQPVGANNGPMMYLPQPAALTKVARTTRAAAGAAAILISHLKFVVGSTRLSVRRSRVAARPSRALRQWTLGSSLSPSNYLQRGL